MHHETWNNIGKLLFVPPFVPADGCGKEEHVLSLLVSWAVLASPAVVQQRIGFAAPHLSSKASDGLSVAPLSRRYVGACRVFGCVENRTRRRPHSAYRGGALHIEPPRRRWYVRGGWVVGAVSSVVPGGLRDVSDLTSRAVGHARSRPRARSGVEVCPGASGACWA